MKNGFADIVLGLQYGDEGKARVIDNLAKDYDIIARFNGGANAGHTIANERGSIAVRQIPSGIFYPQTTLYIGSGCVINIEKIAGEIKELKKLGIDLTKRLKISSQASIVQPHHILLDELLGEGIGTTKNGIGPSYADRAIRMRGEQIVNIRACDLLDDPKHFFAAILSNLKETQTIYKKSSHNNVESLKKAFAEIKPYIELDPLYLEKRVERGAKVLFEGAQSVMLDVVKGSVPYVTSSSTIAAAAYVGGDLSPKYHRKTIGVIKAIMSRVGNGPFPPEFGNKKSEEYCAAATKDGKPAYAKEYEATTYAIDKFIASDDPFEVGIALRMLSGEYGTGTKRPRRVGCMDLVQLAFVTKMNGVDELIITKCDMLNVYSRTKSQKMPIVTGYTLNGKKIDYVPAATSSFYRVKPVIEYQKSFSEDVSSIRKFALLPKPLQAFIKELEGVSGCRVIGLGVGPKRDQYIQCASKN